MDNSWIKEAQQANRQDLRVELDGPVLQPVLLANARLLAAAEREFDRRCGT